MIESLYEKVENIVGKGKSGQFTGYKIFASLTIFTRISFPWIHCSLQLCGKGCECFYAHLDNTQMLLQDLSVQVLILNLWLSTHLCLV